MTAIKKAMEEIEGRIRLTPFGGSGAISRNSLEVCRQTLQVELERENGCEHCDFSSGDIGSSINNSGDDFIMVKSDDDVSIVTEDKHFLLLKIKYCPMCGRKLEPKGV